MEEQSTRRKERKKERITGNKKNIKVKNKKSHHYMMTFNKLEALRERRPPWPRQIITPTSPTVKMLSLGCERLPTPLKKKKKGSGSLPSPRPGYATTITVYFCSFTHLTIIRSPPKFNQFFLVLLRTRP